jgi:hypothetical protein
MSVIGSLAAFDHFRQRVTLIESVPVLDLEPAAIDDAYDAAVASIERAVEDLGRPLPYVAVEPPEPGERLPDVKSTMPDGMYQRAVEVAKEHIVAGDIFQVVLAQRYDLQLDADPFDVYRVLRQVNPSPYMYFLRHPELTIVGSSPEPMVQLLDGTVISRPDRRHPQAGGDRRARPAHGGRAHRAPEGARRARDARRPRAQRRREGRRVRHRQGGRADDAGALQPRDAPDVAGVRRAARRARPDRRAAGDPAGRHGQRERRRCGRWRSSTTWSR